MKYQRLLLILLMLTTLFSTIVPTFAEVESPKVYVDGKLLELNTQPFIINGTTLVPMRIIFEEQGATITNWNNQTKTVTAVKDGISITYTIGENITYKNGQKIILSQPGQIRNGYIMVPLRFISESLGSFVGWHDKSRIITISSSSKEKVEVIRVVDGDTVELKFEDGTEDIARLIGVDTPETKHPTDNVEPFGPEASEFTAETLNGEIVYIAYDVERKDRYDLHLVYLYLESGIFFNAEIVEEGYAEAADSPPNSRWANLFEVLIKDAAESFRGQWEAQIGRDDVKDPVKYKTENEPEIRS